MVHLYNLVQVCHSCCTSGLVIKRFYRKTANRRRFFVEKFFQKSRLSNVRVVTGTWFAVLFMFNF